MTWQPPEPTAWQVEFLITEIWAPLGNPQRDKSRAEAFANNPKVPKECQRVIPFYTHDQLLAVRREAIEECAKKCEEMYEKRRQQVFEAAKRLADDIRKIGAET